MEARKITSLVGVRGLVKGNMYTNRHPEPKQRSRKNMTYRLLERLTPKWKWYKLIAPFGTCLSRMFVVNWWTRVYWIKIWIFLGLMNFRWNGMKLSLAALEELTRNCLKSHELISEKYFITSSLSHSQITVTDFTRGSMESIKSQGKSRIFTSQHLTAFRTNFPIFTF